MTGGFATTRWSQVIAARDGSDTRARGALENLCATYWYPLFAYLRSRGHEPEEARDLTQGFFADLLRRDGIGDVDRDKGRFRSFLLASLRHFVSHQRDKSKALKRGGGQITVSFDPDAAETRYQSEPSHRLTPEEVYEARWGLTILERTMDRLQAESAARDGGALFQRLKPYLTGAEPHDSYRTAAAELGLSEGAIKTAVYRLRQRYGRFLREEIAHTVADPDEIDDEIRHLLAVIRPWQTASV